MTQLLICEDERSAGAWHAEWQLLRECLRLTGGAGHTAVELAEGIEIRPDRMSSNLELTGSRIVSERITAVLAPRLGKSAAKRLLRQASLATGSTGRPLAANLSELTEVAGVFTVEELSSLCDPQLYVGAAGSLVDQAGGRSSTAAVNRSRGRTAPGAGGSPPVAGS